MKLVRLVRMVFETTKPDQQNWDIALDEIEIKTITSGTNISEGRQQFWVVMAAIVKISLPEIIDNKIIIQEKDRKLCESKLEFLLNSISILLSCERKIFSPKICIALIPESIFEFCLLECSDGIDLSKKKQDDFCPPPFDIINNYHILKSLRDRQNGVSLLSEAKSHSLESGKYRDIIRLFENAFSLIPAQLDNKLATFLNPKFGYSRQEIKNWISIRDSINHADFKKSQEIALEVDARKYTGRMEQAAYDVLFNKKTWGDSSIERRDLWEPTSFTDINKTPNVRHGSRFILKIFDSFGAYAYDSDTEIHSLPKFIWCKSITFTGQTIGWSSSLLHA